MIKKIAAAVGAAASLAAVSIAIAQAAPNENATGHANDNAQQRGLSVAGVAGDGPAAVIGAVSGFAKGGGLATASAHLPTTTTEEASP